MATQRKLGRKSDQRMAMLRSLVTNFFKTGRIETTLGRAKETQKIADKMITLAKRGDLHARRQALAFIHEESVVAELFEKTAKNYETRNGGYTRIYKAGPRRGDAAEVAILELV